MDTAVVSLACMEDRFEESLDLVIAKIQEVRGQKEAIVVWE